MKKEEFQRIVKSALAQMRDATIQDLLNADENYQESEARYSQLEIEYMKISETFTEEQQEVVDTYIEAIQQTNIELNDLMYMAGMRDMYRIMTAYNKEKEDIKL